MKTYLKHHGIPGMKWGVRRYQNEDGTLTSSGKARYDTSGKPKHAKDMDDEDLARSNKRLGAERQYNELTGRPYRNRTSGTDMLIKSGTSAIGSFLAVSGAMSASRLLNNGKIESNQIKGIIVPGIIAAIGGAIGSLVTSMGGQVNKDKGGKK